MRLPNILAAFFILFPFVIMVMKRLQFRLLQTASFLYAICIEDKRSGRQKRCYIRRSSHYDEKEDHRVYDRSAFSQQRNLSVSKYLRRLAKVNLPFQITPEFDPNTIKNEFKYQDQIPFGWHLFRFFRLRIFDTVAVKT